MGVEKLSVSFDLELGAAIRAAAVDEDQSVSSWLAEAARDRIRLAAVDDAVRAWERKYGSLTEAEIAAADRALDHAAQQRSPRER